MHLDALPSTGGDTVWASGYAAYDKLSPAFREFIDGKMAVFSSTHTYIDRNDPYAGPKFIQNIHPVVRVHPVTGWKSLWVNRGYTRRIVGLEPGESDAILNYLYNVYESVRILSLGRRAHPSFFAPGFVLTDLTFAL